MRRFIPLLFLLLLAACGTPAGTGMPGSKKFCFIGLSDNPLTEAALAGVSDGLTAAGMVRDRDYTLTVSNAQGDMATLTTMVTAADAAGYDLIFISSTPALQAATQRITSTPVVFTNSATPLAAGAGRTFTDHQPNITGICSMVDMAPMVAAIRRVMPECRTLGTLFVPTEVNSVSYRDALDTACRAAGLTLVSVPVSTSAEIADAATALCSRDIDAVCQIADNCVGAGMAGVIAAARQSRKPLFGFLDETQNEAVASLLIDFRQCGYDAAGLARQILAGTPPAAIPIVPHPQTRMVYNREKAAAFGLTVPA